jgi:hypothetical protein
MTKQEAADILDLIEQRAPRLQRVGVLSVTLGGAGFTLAPAEPVASIDPGADDDKADAEEPKGVLDSPWTHGRPGKDTPSVIKPNRQRI